MSIGQYDEPVNMSIVNMSTHIDRWTGQYPILAYTTWRDLNQSQPHTSIRGITISDRYGWEDKSQPVGK